MTINFDLTKFVPSGGNAYDTNIAGVGDNVLTKDELLTYLKTFMTEAEAEVVAALLMQYDTDGIAGLSVTEITKAINEIKILAGSSADTFITLDDLKVALLNGKFNNLFFSKEAQALLIKALGVSSEQFEKLYSTFGMATLSMLLSKARGGGSGVTTAEKFAEAVQALIAFIDSGQLTTDSVYSRIVAGVYELEARMKAKTAEAGANSDNLAAMMRINAELNTYGNVLNMLIQQFSTRKDMGDKVSNGR